MHFNAFPKSVVKGIGRIVTSGVGQQGSTHFLRGSLFKMADVFVDKSRRSEASRFVESSGYRLFSQHVESEIGQEAAKCVCVPYVWLMAALAKG
jgi:hypothetical protein